MNFLSTIKSVTGAALVCAAVIASTSPLSAAVIGSAVNNGDGTYTYTYKVDNSSGIFDITAWSLEFAFGSPDWDQVDVLSGGEVIIPNDQWFATAGTAILGGSAQDFISLDRVGQVLVGAVLDGFSFTSSFKPGTISFYEFSPAGAFVSGSTMGPVDAASVPDHGGGLWLIALAALGLLSRSRNGKPPTRGRAGFALALGLSSGVHTWSAPTIDSIEVTPTPIGAGDIFTINVAASSDVNNATATLDFRPSLSSLIRVTLFKTASGWSGTGNIPATHQFPPGAKATVNVFAFDANRRRAEKAVSVDVRATALNTAVFEPVTGVLTVIGDDSDNTLIVGLTASNEIIINNGTPPITGGVATPANTKLIRILGLKGNDEIGLIPHSGFPPAELHGGEGNDKIFGGIKPDGLYGGPGNDTITGSLGLDIIQGGEGDDTLNGGDADDVIDGGPGDDTITWNPGDDNDRIEGSAGRDTLLFNGSTAAEKIEILANGTRLRLTRDVANVVLDAGGMEHVQVNSAGGMDTVTIHRLAGTPVTSVTCNLSAVPGFPGGDAQPDAIVLYASGGNDNIRVTGSEQTATVTGANPRVTVTGAEPKLDRLIIHGLEGNDTFDATELPLDVIQLVTEGGPGDDAVLAAVTKELHLYGIPPRAFVYHNSTNMIDTDDVEEVVAFGTPDADTIVINDLTGTDFLRLALDLSENPGSGVGDGAMDRVIIISANTDEHVQITGENDEILVSGLPAGILLLGAEAAHDELSVLTRGGADIIDASTLPAGMINLRLHGELGVDTIRGSDGDDFISGGDGNDLLMGGPGNDVIAWVPGDDNDTIEGEAGDDTLVFSGTNVAENFEAVASGSRLLFFRNVANIILDVNGVEILDIHAAGGPDKILINDLTGTGVKEVAVDLFAFAGSTLRDEQPDHTMITGTLSEDNVSIIGSDDGVTILGLPALITITGSESVFDHLTLNLLDGDDTLDASGLIAGLIQLIVEGGSGDDALLGSAGNDLLRGDSGDDILIGGPGADLLDGGAGTNIVIQD